MSIGESILVTGGAGFIGSHLAERLLRDGRSVTIIDDCSTGSLENLSSLLRNPALRIIQSRVSDCADLPVLCAQASFVFHLAAAPLSGASVPSRIRVMETNIDETAALLLAASTARTSVLLASSSEVYGKSDAPEASESDDLLIGPPQLAQWSLGCSKLSNEFLAFGYHQERELPVIVARIFDTAGPRQTAGSAMLISRFVSAAVRNDPLQIYGGGGENCCFCHVADMVEALIRLKNSPAAGGEIFNIGSTEQITIANLARRVIALTGSHSQIEFIPDRQASPAGFEERSARKPNIAKLRAVTGFEPALGLDEIITSIARDSVVTRLPSGQPLNRKVN